jgi:hypothetical protein
VKSIERRARQAGTGQGLRERHSNLMANRPFVWAFVATLGVLVALAIGSAVATLSSAAGSAGRSRSSR